MKICQNPKCEEELINKRSSAKYCNAKCKNESFIMNKANMLNGMNTPFSLPSTGLPAAQFIIKHQEKENEELRRQLNDALQSKKKIKGKYIDLKDEFVAFKTDEKLERMKRNYEKPEGLAGLMETHGDYIKKVTPQVLGMLQNFMASKSGNAQQMGALPPAGNDTSKEIMSWIAQLDPEFSAAVMQLLISINTSSNQDKTEAMKLITQLLNVINNGTTIANQA